MTDIATLSTALTFDPESGIWRAPRTADIAYPDADNATCFRLEDGSFWFRHRNRCIEAAVRRDPPGGTILDVGGGNGYVTRGLIDAGFDAVVLEPGAAGARNARQARGVPGVICATLDEAAIHAGSAPAVGLFDVLEHIEDDRAFVREIHRILRPGGRLYVTVPSFDWLWSASDVDARHYRRYTRRSLTAVLDGFFQVQYATCLFQRLAPLFFLTRTLPYSLGLTRSKPATAYEAEHAAGGTRLSSAFERLLASEVEAIRQGRSLRLGSSLLVVATRCDR